MKMNLKMAGLKATGLALLLLSIAPQQSKAGIAVSITIAPPVLPVYVQPPCPQEGYLWTPGYWAWGPDGYYWVPGVWVAPPRAGVLWTPGYWGFGGGIYAWHPGYWGPHVGFYGGVNYGFGYAGVGFFGGFWSGGAFRYNTAVVNVNTTVVRNVYVNRTVINNTTVVNRTSFNGPGGIAVQPTAQEQVAMREQHFQATQNQMSHERTAAQDRGALASVNHGRPETTAMDSVNGRRFNQQARIANGVASGRLNANETRNLEGREANVNREVRNERQANGGTLTPQERQQVNRQQNNMSRSIYDDKHNAQAQKRVEQRQNEREPRREER
ncbi:MAG TPA: YXWGXW repeat-containing protein [Bryobacteraceae bacterium]|nr:YXWGXW repeat-containing protein [Bryobacteraceae bacterium]